MLRLRPYKSCDSKHIADWIKNEETFVKWGGERFGSYPINAKIIDDKDVIISYLDLFDSFNFLRLIEVKIEYIIPNCSTNLGVVRDSILNL